MTNLVSQMERNTFIETLRLVVAADKAWGRRTSTSITLEFWLEFLTEQVSKEETLARFSHISYFTEKNLRSLGIGSLQALCYLRILQEVAALKAS
ncbi:hypothetical protein LC612_28275 [Nostoc sp. CHAB 5834]|nr:hypothetical protein [Nostoc sp. CHAB 5834]